jgi:hypothetical protein
MGFDPGPESANRYYAIGFTTAAAINATAYGSAVNSGLNTVTVTGCPNVAFSSTTHTGAVAGVSNNHAGWFPAGKGVGSLIASTNAYIPTTTLGDQASQSTMTFTIGAGGVIAGDFTAATSASQLSINQAKVLQSIRNGF